MRGRKERMQQVMNQLLGLVLIMVSTTPLKVKLGVNITTNTDNATDTTVTEEATTYSRVLYSYIVSPFKFSIKSPDRESQTTLIGKPFINKYEKLSTPKL